MSTLCSPATSPLDVDDLLADILLRLPPQPSSLPRASAVCKRWRFLVSDRRFVRRFHIHHRRKPPLLGCFVERSRSLLFVPTMDAPNRVSRERLSVRTGLGYDFRALGCRHGLALIFDQKLQKFLVCDPVTGDQHQLAIPGFDPTMPSRVNGAVLRAAGDVHFQVVFVATEATLTDDTQSELVLSSELVLAYIYSSETGLWGDLISTPIPSDPGADPFDVLFYPTIVDTTPAVLVGNSLYWQLPVYSSRSILEFDFEKQSLAVVPVPNDVFEDEYSFRVIRADDGGLGLLFVSDSSAQLWERNTDCDGVASWVLGRTIDLDKLLSLDSEVERTIRILGYAEENNMVFLWTGSDCFAIQLQSLQFKKLSEFKIPASHYPFESVFAAGTDIDGEHYGGDLLHNAWMTVWSDMRSGI